MTSITRYLLVHHFGHCRRRDPGESWNRSRSEREPTCGRGEAGAGRGLRLSRRGLRLSRCSAADNSVALCASCRSSAAFAATAPAIVSPPRGVVTTLIPPLAATGVARDGARRSVRDPGIGCRDASSFRGAVAVDSLASLPSLPSGAASGRKLNEPPLSRRSGGPRLCPRRRPLLFIHQARHIVTKTSPANFH
jgi:hypothetical protein